MKEIIKKIVASFDTTKLGFSSRKLTAFIIMTCVVAGHIKWISLGDLNNIESLFIVDYTFVAALFGMTTYSALKNKD